MMDAMKEVRVTSMSQSRASIESELRVSVGPAIGLLVAFGVVAGFVTNHVPSAGLPVRVLILVLFAISAGALLLDSWRAWAGKWSFVAGLSAVVWALSGWLAVPGALALMAIPTALAATLIGTTASAATAAGATVFLLLLWRYGTPYASLAEIGVALTVVWAMVGLMYSASWHARRLAEWSSDYAERARDLLEGARDRQEELNRARDDLTHANRQLTLMNEKLAGMRMIADQAREAKTAFLSRVSHEFRTPLNMIIGLTELMVETPEVLGAYLPPAIFRYLEIVHRNSRHLASMIDDVLALSQMETGQMALQREQVDLVGIINKALVVVTPLIEKRDLELVVDASEDLPEVYCDRTRILQVILNLLSNAARFTEKGGVTIRAEKEDDRVVVSVSDTGPGVSPEDAERIFEPFCQGTTALLRDKGGSGLGLSISKQFVEMHGGRIWLESEPGSGSTFFFTLPRFPPMELVGRPERWISEGWTERTSRAEVSAARLAQRIVVCDEDGELCRWLARCSDEVELVGTRSLPEAVQALLETPAQALMINMPTRDEVLSLVTEARREVPDTPIIGCCCPPRIEHVLADSIADYLVKPVTRADLRQVIQKLGKPLKRVLLVDDDPEALELLTLILRSLDGALEIATASEGGEALEQLRKDPPDLMVLDISMPGMDGWSVLAINDQDESGRDVPVVIVSGLDPRGRPARTEVLVAAMGEGLSLSKLWHCSRALSALLLQPD